MSGWIGDFVDAVEAVSLKSLKAESNIRTSLNLDQIARLRGTIPPTLSQD
jgi:hypothetical protein